MIVSCSDFTATPIDDEVTSEVSFRSACDLDWTITEHNDDGDACKNFRIQINGLTGDCAGCDIDAYRLTLNDNGAIPGDGVVLLGNWEQNGGLYTLENKYRAVGAPNLTYYTQTQYQSLLDLGMGEIIDFDYWTSAYQDVSLCVTMIVVCNGIPETHVFCELIDVACL